MKKIMMMCFAIILAFTGGCSMSDSQKNGNQEEAVKPKDMDPKDLPQVPAFQDERTREYMASTKEMEPGYYLLESKLKGFTMLFPEEAEFVPNLSSQDDNEETLIFESYNKKTNIQYDFQLDYHRNKSFASNSKTMLEIVKGNNNYKGNFEKKEMDGKLIYSANKKKVFDNSNRKYNYSYRYFGYIKSTKEDYLGIEYSFRFACYEDDQPCSLNEKEERKKVEKMINSITFKVKQKEKNDGK
ncbi:lipoprotein YvcA [Bacillus sp. z60-18]|uniref:lipoprotein YvcA n=1 Tax=unclassified Bacillus (in: firmicutes) TaxID=185979 RepID=UPI00390CAD18